MSIGLGRTLLAFQLIRDPMETNNHDDHRGQIELRNGPGIGHRGGVGNADVPTLPHIYERFHASWPHWEWITAALERSPHTL